MRSVLVVGSLNVDRRWRVERHPVVGETVRGGRLPAVPGGKGLNQAVAARRMGARVALVGRVGDDDDGRRLCEVAARAGISTERIERDPVRPTGSALIVLDRDGRNTVTVDPGANDGLTAGGVDVAAGDVVIAQLEVPVAPVLGTFRHAHERGALTILNPSPVPTGREVLDAADVIVVNEHEAAALLDLRDVTADPDEAIDRAAALAGEERTAVVTLGAGGVVSAGARGVHRIDGHVVDVVDSVGAGDCFLGVLAARLGAGAGWADALEVANRAAAIAVTRSGAVDAMPTISEVDAAGAG